LIISVAFVYDLIQCNSQPTTTDTYCCHRVLTCDCWYI